MIFLKKHINYILIVLSQILLSLTIHFKITILQHIELIYFKKIFLIVNLKI